MPIINLLREQNRFMEYAVDKGLKPNDIALWYALMHIINRYADGNKWPDEFISIPNARVLMYSRMTFDTMAKSRGRLKQKGLIDYRCGNRNKEAPVYRMIYFCPEGYPDISDNTAGYPKNTDKTQDKTQDKSGDKTTDKTTDLYRNLNQNNRTVTQTGNMDEEDDEDDDPSAGAWTGANAHGNDRPEDADGDPVEDRRARTELIQAGFRRNFGRLPYPAETERIVTGSWRMGFAPQMAEYAMQKAAERGARCPADYTLSVLEQWLKAEVRQPRQIGEYEVEHSIRTGGEDGLLYGSGDPEEDWKRSLEARERRRAENAEAMA